jgi:hypothetical protein
MMMAGTMGYCKWQNSLTDLHDIKRRLDETHCLYDIGSAKEREAYDRVIALIRELADD